MRLKETAVGVAVIALLIGMAVVVVDRDVPTPLAALPNGARPAATPSSSPTPSLPNLTGKMTELAAQLPPGSVSVAAWNLQTGASFSYGSSSDQKEASIVKLDIMATLMLQKQASDERLSEDERYETTVMIEDSDNDAATDLYQEVGGVSGVTAANRTLGLTCTEPTPDWGLTVTCAEDQVRLLHQLMSPSSPLTQRHRDYILTLMQNVDPSQRWGVPAVADPGTTFSVKNGWLNLEGNTDWVINSLGIVTCDGQTMLIATLSQNNATMASGISLDQQLAKLAAESVTAR